MGRRSINTTKSGKYMNPTDQARKEARKKELKKNKKQRQMVRAAVLKGKDPGQIIEEMEKIDEMEYNVYQPSPLNEKVLREKRKKLKETLDRVLRLYHNDDPELWAELKRKEVEYDKRRNKKVQYYESVKHAQSVQIDEIPLPQMTETPPNTFNVPARIPLPTITVPPGIPPFVLVPPPGIIKKPSELIEDRIKEKVKKEPPGCPPGPPPNVLEMSELDTDAEDDEPNIKRAKTIRFSDEIKSKESSSDSQDDPDPVLDEDEDVVDNEDEDDNQNEIPLGVEKENLADEDNNDEDEREKVNDKEKDNEDEVGDEDDEDDDDDDDDDDDGDDDEASSDVASKDEGADVIKPTNLQQRMLALSGQNIDDFMKEMENVHKKKEQERIDVQERILTIMDKEPEKEIIKEKEIEKPIIEPAPIIQAPTLPPPIKIPSGPPPPPIGIPPPSMMFRPPPLRPSMSGMPMRLPPGPPPGRPGMPSGPPPGMHSRMGIRMPPGPPPGMPPPRLMHQSNQQKNHMQQQNNPMGNVLSAAPQLVTKDSKGATITAKPQIRNLSADVTRFVPSALRVKRDDKVKVKPKTKTQDHLHLHHNQQQSYHQPVHHNRQPEVQRGPTKDDAYMQFMREMQGLL